MPRNSCLDDWDYWKDTTDLDAIPPVIHWPPEPTCEPTMSRPPTSPSHFASKFKSTQLITDLEALANLRSSGYTHICVSRPSGHILSKHRSDAAKTAALRAFSFAPHIEFLEIPHDD